MRKERIGGECQQEGGEGEKHHYTTKSVSGTCEICLVHINFQKFLKRKFSKERNRTCFQE